MDEHRQTRAADSTLPVHARLPVNRCNLPAVILGSLTFQEHPVPLKLDGVEALHHEFFALLDAVHNASQRAGFFSRYMRASFYPDHPQPVAARPPRKKPARDRADYLRMLRGWMFNPDGQEAAVLKSWVESRFGLLPRNHHGPLGDFSGENYQVYLAARSKGLYNTNALEAQLDLLYTYCQYEITRRHEAKKHLLLYRGINRIEEHEVLQRRNSHCYTLLLNNLNSFSADRERADEFGDYILKTQVPLYKLLYMPGLLPATLRGEDEYLAIGGVYRVHVSGL